MRSLMKQASKIILILFSLLLLSCATTGPVKQYTPGRTIDRGVYSITGPPGGGWFVKTRGGSIEFYRPRAPSGSDQIRISPIMSDMMEKEYRYPSEEEEAFDFVNLMEEVVKKRAKEGDCVLREVRKGTTTIGEKKLHFLSSKTSGCRGGPARRVDLLYLFFPADFKERHFYLCFFLNQSSTVEGSLESADLTLLKPVIDGLRIKPQIEVEAEDAKECFQLGVTHMQKGDFDQAILYFDKAIEMDPKNAQAYNARGTAYAARGQYVRAIYEHTKALEIDPKNHSFYCNRAIAFCLKEKYDEAISDCNKALEIAPRDAGAYNERGIAYARKGQYDQAISDYTKALEIDQKYAIKAYFNRGIAYADKGEYDLAISDFNEVIDINPTHDEAYYNRGRSYYLKKEYDKSWGDIKKAQSLGCPIPSEFLDDLRKASGRQE